MNNPRYSPTKTVYSALVYGSNIVEQRLRIEDHDVPDYSVWEYLAYRLRSVKLPLIYIFSRDNLRPKRLMRDSLLFRARTANPVK